MSFANRNYFTPAVVFTLASLAAACTAAGSDDEGEPHEDTASAESPLIINPIKPIGSSGGIKVGPVGPIGPVFAPPVTLPAYYDANSRTSTSVGIGWYETALNPQTLVYRVRYDLDENVIGSPTLIKTFNGLDTGSHGFVDSAATTDDHSGPDTDRKNCYYITERAGGACGPSPGGNTCVSTALACAYTQAATPHPIARVQLRIKTATSSGAGAPGDHIQVRLQSPTYPYALLPIPRDNSTWLDSTSADFTAGSNVTYDLKLNNVSDLSDITQITIATPDNDSLCLSEIELLADNQRAFFKSFGSAGNCAVQSGDGVINTTVTGASFAELRRSPAWQAFSPPDLGIAGHHATFVGYRPAELVSYLDASMGDALRNPANHRGNDAGFQDTHWTTATRTDRRTLHVSQHIIAQDLGWQGDVAADPSYDLVIRNDASCGAKQWCIGIENVNANSSFSGWSSFIPLIGAGIQAIVDSKADGEMAKAMTAMGGNALGAPPAGFEFCFPGRIQDSPFWSDGMVEGSLTLCFAQ